MGRNDLDDLDDASSSPADSRHPILEATDDNLSREDNSDSFISPPPYGDTEGEIDLTTQDGLHTHASVACKCGASLIFVGKIWTETNNR
jgi:hypothetical protein